MLMKSVFQGAGTDEEFRRQLEARKRVTLASAVLGAAAVLSGILMIFLMPDAEQTFFLAGVYCGVGAAAVVLSVKFLLKMKKMLRDESLLRRERIKAGDERNSEIGKKAVSASVTVFMFAMLAALLAAGFFSMEVFWTLWAVTVGYGLLIKLLELYYKRHM